MNVEAFVKPSEINTVSDLKDLLSKAKMKGNTDILGALGDRIYRAKMGEMGYEVLPLHRRRADLLVNGHPEDVKSRLKLEGMLGSKFAIESKRQPGIKYPHVVFYTDVIGIYDTECKLPVLVTSATWEEALKIFRSKPTGNSLREATMAEDLLQKQTLARLEQEVRASGLKAKIIYRSRSNHGQRWEAEAFYHNPIKNRGNIDLVIFVKFDGHGQVCEVLSYPMSASQEIDWIPVPKGLHKKRMTFIDAKLPARFRFKNLNDFRQYVLQRL